MRGWGGRLRSADSDWHAARSSCAVVTVAPRRGGTQRCRSGLPTASAAIAERGRHAASAQSSVNRDRGTPAAARHAGLQRRPSQAWMPWAVAGPGRERDASYSGRRRPNVWWSARGDGVSHPAWPLRDPGQHGPGRGPGGRAGSRLGLGWRANKRAYDCRRPPFGGRGGGARALPRRHLPQPLPQLLPGGHTRPLLVLAVAAALGSGATDFLERPRAGADPSRLPERERLFWSSGHRDRAWSHPSRGVTPGAPLHPFLPRSEWDVADGDGDHVSVCPFAVDELRHGVPGQPVRSSRRLRPERGPPSAPPRRSRGCQRCGGSPPRIGHAPKAWKRVTEIAVEFPFNSSSCVQKFTK